MNISEIKFQAIFSNSYFVLSFLTTIYYWIKAIFFSEKKYRSYGFFGFIVINILLISQLLSRWIEAGHFPLSGLYESLLFLSWGLISIYLVIENFIKNEFLGVIIAPLVLCILGFSGFSLPDELQTIKPLVPALQSNWLFMHVSVMMLSYSALLIGSLLSISYLVVYNFFTEQQSPVSLNQNEINSNIKSIKIHTNRFNSFLTIFDNLSYRTIGIGFCFLTLGILSGAVWANETWGTYWSWDPKETWALITWLIFASYLHLRLLYGWQGIKPATIASLGFILIWICYLGVNLLGKGLHSYGFFN